MGKIYDPVRCDNFEDFIEKVRELPPDSPHGWIFRGHEKACWELRTSLERECERFGISGDEAFRREYNMIREFQRRLHHYETSVPGLKNVDEWMGLMQHYGAPTRLLDFTYSPYVAAFFAFEKAESGKAVASKNEESGKVAIWAVDAGWIQNEFKEKFKCQKDEYERYQNYRDPEAFRSLFLGNLDNMYYALAVTPFRLNDRLAYQQGVFLCPASVRVGFMENLGALANPRQAYAPVKKFTIEVGECGKHRNDALDHLHLMNINRITLFPGLVGFAESFKVGLKTVYGKHEVIRDGSPMPPNELWPNFFESMAVREQGLA